jgi:hypothetical protein
MNTRPLYIFDLDGTLALIEHRRHFVERDDKAKLKRKPDWDAFHAACVDDLPNKPVIDVLEKLAKGSDDVGFGAEPGAEIWIFSGRSSTVHFETGAWLKEHISASCLRDIRLTMRPAGDFTPDDVLKRSWYDAMSAEDKARLVATFDDRDRVVKMWRDAGVTCFQVAPGDF